MQNSGFSGFADEMGEKVLEQGKRAVKNVVGGVAASVKQQLVGDQTSETSETSKASKTAQKIDPTTGKPVPSKQILTQLNQQVAQLAQMRLKKVREELEKQRLKTSETSKTSQIEGPEVKMEDKKPKDDAVQKTLAASKSTGEFKGLVGG